MHFSRLKTINLSNCYKLSDEAFKYMDASSRLSLREVYLSNCAGITTASVLKIASSCAELSCLSLEGVPKVNDTAIVALAQKHCRLRELNLSARLLGNTSSSNVPRCGPRGVIAIGQHCADLRILRCNSCSRIDDLSMIVLAKGCPRIEELSMKRCYKLGDKALSAIGKHCHCLRRVLLSSCKEMTDYGIEKLVAGCPDIVEIDLSNVRVTDRGIERLSHYCRGLVSIVLQNCYRVTDRSLLWLVNRCNCLENIDATGVDLLTGEAFRRSYLPDLRSAIFAGTNASEEVLDILSIKSRFCSKPGGKSALSPLYPALNVHRQHKLVRTMISISRMTLLNSYVVHQLISVALFANALSIYHFYGNNSVLYAAPLKHTC